MKAFGVTPWPPFVLVADAPPPGPATPSYFELDLLAYLRDDLGITCFPGVIPEDEDLPALAFTLVSGESEYVLSRATGNASARYLLSIYSADYREVAILAERLRRGLEGFRGMMGSTRVQWASIDNEASSHVASPVTSDDGTHGKATTYQFHYRRSIPSFG